MIKRLDVKFVLTLIITAVVPIVASIYLVTEAVKTSLGVGLNKDIAASLSKSVTVHKNYIEAIKANHTGVMLRLSDSARLAHACAASDEEQIETVLRSFLASASIKQISLAFGNRELVVQKAMDESRYRSVTRQSSLKNAVCKNVEVVFAVDRDITGNFNEAAQYTETYGALFRAPRTYLTRRVIMIYGIFLGLIVIISVWQGVFWTRRFTRRLHTLNLATKSVAEGDLSVRVDPGGQDEVAELIGSFNTMVDEIASTRARIEYLQKISTWQEIARRLAHEIKNPLTPIHLAAQQLKNKYDANDPKFGRLLEQSVDIIEEEVVTLKRLVTDFSSFAKLPQISPSPVEVGAFLEDCESSLEYIAEQNELELIFEKPAAGLMVSIDVMMMKRVVDNLIRNAAEAMTNADVEHPKIRVRVEKVKKSNEVAIRFEDNGPGVLPEHHPSLFEPYFTTKEEGTGLGLAISKKIVLEHNGVIWIDDEQEKGASFVVQLPLVKKPKKR
ncbi:MAG: HAMP domain-containing protein [Deltaproteobacteria bacterium]|nr:HAMP domain-containing protein [Deltaproteobacteria bacterium]MBN2670744.1 HAMP domain-containing protein [Deltaproteobacteria bacterium]